MIGFLDCYSGLSGDMLLGALVDAGLAIERLEATVDALGLSQDVRVRAETVIRAGVRATRVAVKASATPTGRTLPEIAKLLEGSSLAKPVLNTSLEVLTRLAEVEARIHGRQPAELELHELGSLDAIVDTVGVVAGLAALEVDKLYASALPLAPSRIAGGDHGHLPGPAPATLALLAEVGAPTQPWGLGYELITPTGAALVARLARFSQPPMRLARIGYGAGAAELPWPNVLRLWLGSPIGNDIDGSTTHVVLETNIDDMTPQLLVPATEALFAAGALDVTVSPLSMKKGRQGWLVSVIARAAEEAVLAGTLLRETSTMGVRVHEVRRYEADRRPAEVDTPYGRVAVKLKLLGGTVVAATPEFESVRAAAVATRAGLAAVHGAATAAAARLVATPSAYDPHPSPTSAD